MERPRLTVAVVLKRLCQPSRWEAWRWSVDQVLLDDGRFGTQPRRLRDDGREALWLHPGLTVELSPDEAAGYALNLGSPETVWFVLWRIDEEDLARAYPVSATLSYDVAGRWLDAQERVDNTPVPPDVRDLLADYTAAHHRPEPRERRRPQSFVRPEDRR